MVINHHSYNLEVEGHTCDKVECFAAVWTVQGRGDSTPTCQAQRCKFNDLVKASYPIKYKPPGAADAYKTACGGSWPKVSSHYCTPYVANAAYSTLGTAKAACAALTTCGGVYDSACDGQGYYRLCQVEGTTWKAAEQSCIYAKPSIGCVAYGREMKYKNNIAGQAMSIVADPQACRARCAAVTTCEFFTYTPNVTKCELSSGVNTERIDSTTTSDGRSVMVGHKLCAASTAVSSNSATLETCEQPNPFSALITATVKSPASCNFGMSVTSGDTCKFGMVGFSCSTSECYAGLWLSPTITCTPKTCPYNDLSSHILSYPVLTPSGTPTFPTAVAFYTNISATIHGSTDCATGKSVGHEGRCNFRLAGYSCGSDDCYAGHWQNVLRGNKITCTENDCPFDGTIGKIDVSRPDNGQGTGVGITAFKGPTITPSNPDVTAQPNGFCANSNGLTGYEFSHNGYFEKAKARAHPSLPFHHEIPLHPSPSSLLHHPFFFTPSSPTLLSGRFFQHGTYVQL